MNPPTGIKSWPKTERPRERLLAGGPEGLSDSELLAVLLRNGVKGKDAVSLARELLAKHGDNVAFYAEDEIQPKNNHSARNSLNICLQSAT